MAAFYFTAGFSLEKVTKTQSFSEVKKLSLRATRSAGRGVMSADHNFKSDRPYPFKELTLTLDCN